MFVCLRRWFYFDCHKPQVLDVVLAGHNTFIAGAAGSGKSFQVKQISERTRKAVKVTSTTGPTAKTFKNIKRKNNLFICRHW